MTNSSLQKSEQNGWKILVIACICGALFLGLLFLAMSNEPEYMPSQQKTKQAAEQVAQSTDAVQPHSSAPHAAAEHSTH